MLKLKTAEYHPQTVEIIKVTLHWNDEIDFSLGVKIQVPHIPNGKNKTNAHLCGGFGNFFIALKEIAIWKAQEINLLYHFTIQQTARVRLVYMAKKAG